MEPFRCANRECGLDLPADHAILITGSVVRRYCDVECVADGYGLDVERAMDEVEVQHAWNPSDEHPEWLG